MYRPMGTYDKKEQDAGMRDYMEGVAVSYLFEMWKDSYADSMRFEQYMAFEDFEIKYKEIESGCCRVDAICELWIDNELEASWMRNICR